MHRQLNYVFDNTKRLDCYFGVGIRFGITDAFFKSTCAFE